MSTDLPRPVLPAPAGMVRDGPVADRIDHVAEALSLLSTPAALAESIRGREEVSEEWVDELRDAAARSIATAQVHATLALVEQQRIANLIALADAAGDPDILVSPAEQQAWNALGVRGTGVLRPDIAAALGIEVGGDD